VSFIVQLSDLHVGSGDADEAAIQAALVEAVRAEMQDRGSRPDLLALTGDIFDDVHAPDAVITRFLRLLDGLFEAFGRVPTVILPGNHDRRVSGFVRSGQQRLWERLDEMTGERAYVHGTETPHLDAVLPADFANVPARLVAYDSTHLPVGWLSAGGIIRPQDILRAAHRIGSDEPDLPVVFMLHHHLVPTPLTDVGRVDLDGRWAPLRWAVEHVLPALIANADREELTMTALGSGTALSTLHTLGRPILVLHGHKHYATARHLGAVQEGQGDVLLVAAGSAGKAQPWFPTTANDVARLWPSFNVVRLEEERLEIDVVSFGYSEDARGDRAARPLVRARKDGSRWRTAAVRGGSAFTTERRLTSNDLHCIVRPSDDPARWDVEYRRGFDGASGEAPDSFREVVDAIEDGTLEMEASDALRAAPSDEHPPFGITLNRGCTSVFTIRRALCRTFDDAARLFGPRHPPYAWLGLMNRYVADLARLEIVAPDFVCDGAFASRTDLGTGLEEPCGLERAPGGLVLAVRSCPPRTMLRVYWPLDAR